MLSRRPTSSWWTAPPAGVRPWRRRSAAGKDYLGPYRRVRTALAPLRRGLPLDEPRERQPSPREAARWIIASPVRHGPQTAERLRQLLDHCLVLHRTQETVREFAAMLDARDATTLPDWLDHLTNSGLPPLAGIASCPARRPERGRPGDHQPLQLRSQRGPSSFGGWAAVDA